MSGANDGGPAFPLPLTATNDGGVIDTVDYAGRKANGGMSLRDWFAGQALVGIGTWAPGSDTTLKERAENQARHAYRVADAMLMEKEKS